jgi:hypothetical protein
MLRIPHYLENGPSDDGEVSGSRTGRPLLFRNNLFYLSLVLFSVRDRVNSMKRCGWKE